MSFITSPAIIVPPLTAGGVAYGTGSQAKVNSAGTVGQVLTSAGAGVPTWATAAAAGFTLATPVASTSGSSIDFTGIPSGVKQIVIMFKGVSTIGTSPKIFRLGDSGGIETTGYVSIACQTNSISQSTQLTSGFSLFSAVAADELSGSITLSLLNATTFTWVASGVLCEALSGVSTIQIAGVKSLSATLDRIRFTTTGGGQTFDGGEINIAYI